MSGEPERPFWLRSQRAKVWLKTVASAGILLRFLEVGRSAVAEPLELATEIGVLLWTVWSWYSYLQNLRTWREMKAHPLDHPRV